MLAFLLVLGFPLILMLGYGLAHVLTRHNRRLLLGALGFFLFLALLTIPLTAVLVDKPQMLENVLAWQTWTPAWIAAGIVSGMLLWALQRILTRREVPTSESPIWVGPQGWGGFGLLLLPVACIVLAEELVWRGFLMTAIGLPLSSAAFALHHYHFGARHVVFAFLAGLVWGGLFLVADELWPALASHMTYNALAWARLRKRASGPAHQSDEDRFPVAKTSPTP
jgi:membrane protease YdiL (CAAX protease family)